MILGIETSCDDTCAAVVTADGALRSNVISSQGIHDAYGGVVPEIASRQHLEVLDSVVDDTLERAGATLADVEEVAVTRGPGLIGALLVGLSAAKALADAVPLVISFLAGLLGLAYGGFSFTRETHTAQIGPIALSVKEKETVEKRSVVPLSVFDFFV